jgi:hypothetical protein
MSLRARLLYSILLLTSVHSCVCGQVKKKIREYERRFQFSLFPGISTNGISSGSYYNNFSLNLFGGLSAGNRHVEIGVISNVNLKSSSGIQIAGLANIVGANAFINLSQSEERTLIITEDFESNSKGIQLSGMLNYVRDNVAGFQLSGGFNHAGGDFTGVQIGGIGNSAGGTSAGLMLAGFYNLSRESVGGFQISSVFNYTDFQLSGMQLGLMNKARIIRGNKSTPPTRSRGLQIGLINSSKEMDGVQIGLINFGGTVRGKQIGLINFFDRNPSKEFTRMGTSVGLLNLGSKGSVLRLNANEIFATNIEYTTGNCLNCSWVMLSEMPYHDDWKIYNQNALILGFDPFFRTWGFGYGFMKILFNKFTVRPHILNEKKMISYGVRFMHLNRDLSFDKSFNVLTRLHCDFGKRFSSFYLFGGLSLNYFLSESSEENIYAVRSVKVRGKISGLNSDVWPGYSIGLQL